MKTLWIDKKFTYDGSQLKSLFAYMNYGLLGDSAVAWEGPCNIPFAHMVDGEDVRAQSEIRSDMMIHFIAEIFDQKLFAGVVFQRLMASLAKELIYELTPAHTTLKREGDDLYLDDKKLSISIATVSHLSTLIHFAVNVTTKGTPVPTLGLEDLKIKPTDFAQALLIKVQNEFLSIKDATMKVRAVS